jgi:hypothetical protein
VISHPRSCKHRIIVGRVKPAIFIAFQCKGRRVSPALQKMQCVLLAFVFIGCASRFSCAPSVINHPRGCKHRIIVGWVKPAVFVAFQFKGSRVSPALQKMQCVLLAFVFIGCASRFSCAPSVISHPRGCKHRIIVGRVKPAVFVAFQFKGSRVSPALQKMQCIFIGFRFYRACKSFFLRTVCDKPSARLQASNNRRAGETRHFYSISVQRLAGFTRPTKDVMHIYWLSFL